MNDFNFKIPQDIIFGKGSLSRLPEVLKEANCKKVLLVSDHGLEAVGVVAKVEKIITEAGLGYAQFLDLQPNPTIDNVNAALEVYKSSGAESIIALGGGARWTLPSPLVCWPPMAARSPTTPASARCPARSFR